MRRLLDITLDLKPAFLGTASLGLCTILEGISTVVGILVGLATLVYLTLRIRREIRQ